MGHYTVAVNPVGFSFTSNILVLLPNRVNQFCVTGISTCGNIRSAPTPVVVTHDEEPPNLFIDFPVDEAEIMAATTDVSGRVGDTLSGFMGLSVVVDCSATDCQGNSIMADVDAGIGPNGTFYAQNVPLDLGINQIFVTATDYLGNEFTDSITITRVDFPAGVPRLMEVDGNGQPPAEMKNRLPDPIRVRVTESDGVTPITNKVVTFNVTRSDGRLEASKLGAPQCMGSGTMQLQCRTNIDGIAEALWTLGSDAGFGNNRVEVTSTSIAGSVMFSASAIPADPRQINVGLGNNQRAEVGSPAHEPLRVWVNDSCNGVDDVPVSFTVTRGGGLFSNGQSSIIIDTGDTGHAEVTFTLGPEPGNNIVEATYPLNSGQPAVFMVYGVARNPAMPPSLSGVVLDNAHQPIGGVTCSLMFENSEDDMTMFTGANGQFRFDNIPVTGPVNLRIDGASADLLNGVLIPMVDRPAFPALHFMPILIPNAENTLAGPVLLPRKNPANKRYYDGLLNANQDLELTVEGIEGLKMIVKAGTTIELYNGAMRVGPNDPGVVELSLNQVHHDDIPMPIPDGAAPPFAWTLQPGGAKFDKPVEIEYPNMSGLPPGALSNFLTFNHDTNRFEIFGTGRVSNDGSIIRTDPGVGITTSGWGCNCPPYSVTGDCCSGCGGSCCYGTCCGGQCVSGYCCNGSPCSHPCTVCVDSGLIQGGEIQVTPEFPCIDQEITFKLMGISDTGGLRKINCEQPDPLGPTNSFTYTWQVTKPSGNIVSGSGSSPQVTVTANEPGIYHFSITAKTNRHCPATRIYGALSPSVGPGIISATEWLVVHDPELEVKCQQGRCKQAELMMNEAVVRVQTSDGPCGTIDVMLVEADPVFNDEIVNAGYSTEVGDNVVEYHFRTTFGSTNGGAMTDASGNIYIENEVLEDGITGSDLNPLNPEYRFVLYVDDEEVGTDERFARDVVINPLLYDLTYGPNILATPPATLDPYSDFFDIELSLDFGLPHGYDAGEGFGLLIHYYLYGNLEYPPIFAFKNDSTSWGGDAGIAGEYTLDFASSSPFLYTAGLTQKEIKWEGFTDNSVVVDATGTGERAGSIFMDVSEAELPMPFDIGDGVLQSHRGVAPKYIAKEGHYIHEIRVRRSLDTSQLQKLQIPFEVKYELE